MVAENIHFTVLHGAARASALWLEHVITPAVDSKHLRSRFFFQYVSFSKVDTDSWLVNAFMQTGGEHDTHVT